MNAALQANGKVTERRAAETRMEDHGARARARAAAAAAGSGGGGGGGGGSN